MKIALLIKGIAYNNQYRQGVNYKRTLQGMWDNIILPLRNGENSREVDIYLATYKTKGAENIMDDIENDYDAFDITFLNFEGATQTRTAITGLEMIKRECDGCSYDAVIMTRFDVEWKMPISKWNIDWSKINFVWRETQRMWEQSRRVGDVVFVFPAKYIDVMILALKENPHPENMHCIYPNVVGHMRERYGLSEEKCIHLIVSDGYYDSGRGMNPLYTLVRGI